MKRMIPLVFGAYAWTDNEGKREIKEAGSGVFVAHRIALTARHVAESFMRLDSQYDGFVKRWTPLDSQYRRVVAEGDYGAKAYQVVPGSREPAPDDRREWSIPINWPSDDTDIAVFTMKPETDGARTVDAGRQTYLDWYLTGPPLGATVHIYGFPEPRIETDNEMHIVNAQLEIAVARVDELIYPIYRHRFCEFPAFRLSRDLAGGFSGSPVVWNDHLVGIFVGPEFAACLWPLALLAYQDKEHREYPFRELFDNETIAAWDWNEVKDRVRRVPCEEAIGGTPLDERCARNHVILV